ncbi:MAG: alpha/beta fold hydrolase [Candidatus Babeliales bacterium]
MYPIFQKLFSYFFVLTISGSLVITGFTYNVIKKFTQRPVYSQARKQEIEQNRNLLLEQFHAQPIRFKTEDGLELSGLFFLREGAQRNVLICHGFRMAKERLILFVSMFANDNILLFDHRAHGESEGTRVTLGFDEKRDVLAALNVFLKEEKTRELPIYGIGLSMGAVSLLGAAAENPIFKGIVLDSPFARLDLQARRTIERKYKLIYSPFEPLGKLVFYYVMHFSPEEVNALAWAEKIQMPVLMIHSMQDRTALFDDAQQIYANMKGKKELWAVDGSKHARIFIDFQDDYCQKVNQFFNASLLVS